MQLLPSRRAARIAQALNGPPPPRLQSAQWSTRSYLSHVMLLRHPLALKQASCSSAAATHRALRAHPCSPSTSSAACGSRCSPCRRRARQLWQSCHPRGGGWSCVVEGLLRCLTRIEPNVNRIPPAFPSYGSFSLLLPSCLLLRVPGMVWAADALPDMPQASPSHSKRISTRALR